ncbi:MAG: hypothetical protein RI900_482 [Actinomycetota bacterium]
MAAGGLLVAACGGSDSSTATTAGGADTTAAVVETTTGTETPETTAPTEPSGPKILRVGRSFSVDGWKGDGCLSGASLVTYPIVYDTLLRIAPDGLGPVPSLALSVDWDDATNSYTIALRPDLKFSDGSVLDAEDVKFSIEQWKAGPVSGVFYSTVESVTVVDPQTLTVKMIGPDSFFPNLLMWCTSTVYPLDFGGLSEEEYFKKPIGAGPFMVDEWRNPGPTETIVLKPNPNHWAGPGGGSNLEGIEFRSSLDQSQQLVAFDAGELDLVEVVDPFTAKDLDQDKLVAPVPVPITLLGMNVKRDAFADPAVRAAVSQAIDRETLASLLEGYGEAATGVLPINVPGWSQGTTEYTYDPDAARAVLEPLGLSVELVYDSASNTTAAAAEVLGAQLGEAGVEVKLSAVDNATSIGRASSGDFDMVILQLTAISPTVFDPMSALFGLYYPWVGGDGTVITESYFGGTSTFDSAAQKAAVDAMQDDARAQNALLGLYNFSVVFAVSPQVQGFAPFRYGMYYPDAISMT